MLTHLQRYITDANYKIEKDMGCPYFTFNNTNYTFIPSVAEFKKDLDTGGFEQVRMLSGTVRLFNLDGSSVFPSTRPVPQNKITYSVDGKTYRIESLNTDPTQSYLRFVAVFQYRGV